MELYGQMKLHDGPHRITDLPQPVLEQILISRMSKQDKKALRQTCKLFRQIVEETLTSISISDDRKGKVNKKEQLKDQICLKNLLKRLQHVPGLKAAYIHVPYDPSSVIQYLPEQLSTLIVTCPSLRNTSGFRSLQGLTDLWAYTYSKTGLKNISGVTRLDATKFVGSIAHVAPTLRHLTVYDMEDVQDLDQCHKLEVLDVRGPYSARFILQKRGQVPLKALRLQDIKCEDVFHTPALVPTSLTRLAVSVRQGMGRLEALPRSITHLHLMFWREGFQKVATALPCLVSLDLCDVVLCDNQGRPYPRDTFSHLSKLTQLRSLGLLLFKGGDHRWTREEMLSMIPEVAEVVGRGVTLNALSSRHEFWGVTQDLPWLKTQWNVHA